MFKRYLRIFIISIQNEFAYRMNFIMWRFRNIIQIVVAYFLWNALFSAPDQILFGYTKNKMITYIFSLIIVRALVFSNKATDAAGEISDGDLSNYLVKPINYFRYWFTRDISSKILNLCFAAVETFLIFLLLKPQFFLQTNPLFIAGFLISIGIAVSLHFCMIFIVNCVPFWIPELAWGIHFLTTVIIIEFLSGAAFPLDILPSGLQTAISLTPFPYLIFFPISVYLGTITGFNLLKGLLISFIWLIILYLLFKYTWKKGLKVYQAYGK